MLNILDLARNVFGQQQQQIQQNVHPFFEALQSLRNSAQMYPANVAYNKQHLPSPFFNNTGNSPSQWLGKVYQDAQARGPFEGLQDLSNPIIQNQHVYPYAEPIIGAVRMANFRAGRPIPLINELLGQTPHTKPGTFY